MPRQVLINSTKQDAVILASVLGKLAYDEKTGEQILIVPDWIELMFIHGKEDTE